MKDDLEFAYTNMSSVQNIPADLKKLLQDVIEVYKAVYGEQLRSIYAIGSLVRGAMVRGSDADFFAIISGKQTDDQRNERDQKLEFAGKPYQKYGLAYVDGIAIPEEEFATDFRRPQLIKIQVDGVCIYGREYDFRSYLPKTRREFAHLFESDFPQSVRDTSRLWGEVQKARRGYAKSIIRAIYDHIAFPSGAEFTRSIGMMLPAIRTHATQYGETADWLYKCYTSTEIKDIDTFRIEQIGKEVLLEIQKLDSDSGIKL
jgi:predicted nucleotidyltransferase